jgi:hypothetical protein
MFFNALLFTVADDNISIKTNSGAERPYLAKAMRFDLFFCNTIMRCFNKYSIDHNKNSQYGLQSITLRGHIAN